MADVEGELAVSIGLLTTTLLSLRSPPLVHRPSWSETTMNRLQEEEEEKEGVIGYQAKTIKDLQVQVKALEVEVEDKEQSLAELNLTLAERSEAVQALQAKLATHVNEAQVMIDDRVQMEKARMLQELSESRAQYEAKIIEIQRGYESRILDLQQHESKFVAMQQQHDAVVDSLNAQHDMAVRELERKEKEVQARVSKH